MRIARPSRLVQLAFLLLPDLFIAFIHILIENETIPIDEMHWKPKAIIVMELIIIATMAHRNLFIVIVQLIPFEQNKIEK